MNLKYYLRGLGVGVIVTALIMGISLNGKKESLSDEEIRERASKLGMVEESTLTHDVLSAVSPDPAEKKQEAEPTLKPAPPKEEAMPSPLDEEPAASAQEEEATPSPLMQEPTASPQEEEPTPSPLAEEPTASPETESISEEDTVTIRVNSGESSYTVCTKLQEAGLIESASEFDRYLYESGYDRRISIGTHQIPKNADRDQIARILAGLA